MKYKVIDLFCGCGGLSQGFMQAGFNIVMGVDNWDCAVRTYQKNFPHALSIVGDLSKPGLDNMKSKIADTNYKIDVVVGGPPCQGFSLSGKRLMSDPRNNLYRSFVDIVSDVKPKIFLMENVPGIVKLYNGMVRDRIVEDFASLGYDLKYKVLSAEKYGVPQIRKRVFFVGISRNEIYNTEHFLFPEETHGTDAWNRQVITCADAISDLDFIPDDTALQDPRDYVLDADSDYQLLMRANSRCIINHVATIHTEQTKRIIAMVPDGGNYKNLPLHLHDTRKVNIAWTRMNSKKPCFTIDTGHNHHFHYRANRVPTVRESARIQSFPDIFEFCGNKTEQLRQVGNAVPPILAQALANKIMAVLERG